MIAAAGHDTTLGFANPFLYANQDAFLDITKGYNRGSSALEGHDPISDLGTFSTTTYSLLKDAALAAAEQRAGSQDEGELGARSAPRTGIWGRTRVYR